MPATLTLYYLTFTTPVIQRDGVDCSDCIFESYIDGDLVFNVTGFSIYSAREGDTGGNGGTSCFPAGTKILMADGTYKNIEDVKVGDEIESYDLVAGELTTAEVLELESPLREGFYSINNKQKFYKLEICVNYY